MPVLDANGVEITNPRFYDRVWKLSAYRTGPTRGFVGEHPEFFNPQPNLLEISTLRVQFKVEKNLAKDPNTCEVIVTNAAPGTRTDLCRTPLVLRIDAGHRQDAGARHVFTGSLRHGYSKRDGVNWSTVLELGDGAAMFDGARASRAFTRGTRKVDVVRYVASTMGVELPRELANDPDLQRTIASGETVYGDSHAEMTRLLAPFGYSWSVQDGRFQALRDEQAAPGTALVISKDTGLIGSPQFKTPSKGDVKKNKPPELTFKTILYPQITPGFLAHVQSEAIDGIFRAERVTHTGDSHSNDDWVTEVECKPVDNASAR